MPSSGFPESYSPVLPVSQSSSSIIGRSSFSVAAGEAAVPFSSKVSPAEITVHSIGTTNAPSFSSKAWSCCTVAIPGTLPEVTETTATGWRRHSCRYRSMTFFSAAEKEAL